MHFDQIRDEFAKLESEIADGPIVPNVTAEEIRAHLGSRYDFKRTMALDEVIADVEQMLRKWQVQVTHPRYFGLFNPSVTLASVVADTLVAMYNPQLANWRTSPAANEIERHTLAWLTDKFGLPEDSIATFTSGGTEANLSAVVVALTWAFPEYGEHGLRSSPANPQSISLKRPITASTRSRTWRGLDGGALRTIATDCGLKMNVDELKRRVAEDRKNGFLPFMVIGTAGTTAAGVIDPLAEIGAFLPGRRPVVSCRRRVGRRRCCFAQPQAPSRWN